MIPSTMALPTNIPTIQHEPNKNELNKGKHPTFNEQTFQNLILDHSMMNIWTTLASFPLS
jgi:hypothetical protein